MFSEQQAKELFETTWWEGEKLASGITDKSMISDKVLAIFQLSQNALCMPYHVYHAAVERAIGEGFRPDKLHTLRYDFLMVLTGKKYSQSDEQCLALLPEYVRLALK